MIKRLLPTLLALLAYALCTPAQEQLTWEDFVERLSDGEDGSEEALLDRLYEIHCSPINLATATSGQLAELPFLSESQIDDILLYRDRYGTLAGKGELLGIKSLDAATRKALCLFCYFGEDDSKKRKSKTVKMRGASEAVWRTDIPLYTKDGYKDYSDDVLEKTPNKVYAGDKFRHTARYRFKSRHLSIGATAEQDAGERGVDYASAYALIRDAGVLKTLALGDFRASFGYGLVVNSSFKMGKTMSLSSVDKMNKGFTQHSSTSETNFYRGVAGTVKLGDYTLSAFASYKPEDGTFLSDSSGLSALKTDGLHRTKTERDKKGNYTNTTFGANVRADFGRLSLTATWALTRYSVPLLPKYDTESTLYKKYNPRGQTFEAYGIAYSYYAKNLKLGGEVATSRSGGWATVNSLHTEIGASNTLTAIYRYYSARYASVNGSSFGENSTVRNECGLYVGWHSALGKRLKLDAYVDGMYFPWMKYQVSGSSYGVDGMLQLCYSPNKKNSITLRYKVKSKQRDCVTNEKEDIEQLRFRTSNSLRLQYSYAPSKRFSTKTSLYGQTRQQSSGDTDSGFAIAENLRLSSRGGTRFAELAVAYFNTDGYNSRISLYEPTLHYSYGFTSLYYHGIRAALLVNVPLTKDLMLSTKVGHTKYFNRSEIGSSRERIAASHKEDIYVQLRWKF